MRVGRSTASITLAIVKVLPLPVTPSRTWCFLPERNPSTSLRIASGWSPFGSNSVVSLNRPPTSIPPGRPGRARCGRYHNDKIPLSGGRSLTTPQRVAPPPVEAFGDWRRAAGAGSARIEISDIAVEFDGLPETLLDRMSVVYAPYLVRPTGEGRPLRVTIHQAPVEYFVPPPAPTAPAEEYRMYTDLR